MSKIHIVYASTSGNVELVCHEVSKMLRDKRTEIEMHRAEVTNIDVIKKNETFILATSTWEHGEINPYFDDILEQIAEVDLSGKRAGFIGLGDLRYEKHMFCEGAEILRRTFLEQGGEQIGTTLKMNGDPHNQIDSIVKNWVQKFSEEL